jgi:hypothetical protein
VRQINDLERILDLIASTAMTRRPRKCNAALITFNNRRAEIAANDLSSKMSTLKCRHEVVSILKNNLSGVEGAEGLVENSNVRLAGLLPTLLNAHAWNIKCVN